MSVEFGDYCATPSAFYGVYDGHGGQRAAEFVKNTLHHKIIATDKFKNDDIEGAIKDGYLNTVGYVLFGVAVCRIGFASLMSIVGDNNVCRTMNC